MGPCIQKRPTQTAPNTSDRTSVTRTWKITLAVDRALYRADLRSRTYRYIERNPDWNGVLPTDNARNKRQLHGLKRILRDGTTRTFIDKTWPYSEHQPCATCYSWVPRDSPCDHEKYECPKCGRRQCVRHWRYPMKSRREAQHFLRSAQVVTGKACFIRPVKKQLRSKTATVWKIFTSEEDFRLYRRTSKHAR